MEENMNKYSQVKLNFYTYRELQRIAKGMDLPSNVKKVHLIELIHAKQYKSQEVLNEIIDYVRLERREKSAAKRGRNVKKYCIQTRPVNNRVRKISGISPLATPERSTNTYIRTMNFIDQTGRMTRLKAFIKKPLSILNKNFTDTSNSLLKNNNKQGSNVVVRLIKEPGTSNPNDQGNIKNTYKVDLVIEKSQNSIEDNVIDANLNANDNEMEINQAENESINEESETVENCDGDVLQNTNIVFSNFNDGINSTLLEPISVQVSEDAERTHTSPSSYMTTNSTTDYGVLEYVYNYKNQFMTSSDSFQHVTTTSNTNCVYSTSTVTTAIQQPPASIINEYNACGNDLSMQDSEYDGTLYEFLPFDIQKETVDNEFICNEVLNSSESLETGGVEVSETIPEMVEDALEIISQDGDYMERISLDTRMQCFLCPWFGAKSLLDNHFKQYHMDEIETYLSEEWVITYTLGSLVQRDAWSCKVIQYDSQLYVLSAKYEDPDILLASVNAFVADSAITKLAKITTFNRLTGEPFVWMGPVYGIPDTLPYDNKSHCFRLELSKMNLLPNSTDLRQVNGESVVEAPKRVIVGQPALNDIHINLFVKLSNIITV